MATPDQDGPTLGPLPPGDSNRLTLTIVAWIVVTILMMSWFGGGQRSTAPQELPYSEFKAQLRAGAVKTVELRGERIEGELKHGDTAPQGTGGARFVSRIPSVGDASLLALLEQHAVVVVAMEPPAEGVLSKLLVAVLPWVLLIGVYLWIMRRFSRNLPGGAGGFLNKQKAPPAAKRPSTRFADVAGQENAKREVAELVDYLRDPDRYQRVGADVPHGVLLVGPPGTGKTLLARALAGEAEVPFFSVSASEFIEVFVGVGAARVRTLFEEARKQAPSILFIDELDSIGRTRGTGLGGGNDEREQTLNQILAELDGFENDKAVVVLSATNRPDVLDPALLRPGRFDRHISLDLPDRSARAAILAIHAAKLPLAKGIDLDRIAAGTPGFSGADLKNLVNEAAMRAARAERKTVCGEDFDAMRDRVLMGSERKLAMQPEERHRLAVHEAGHTTVGCFLDKADPVFKVSIIPRGQALGATQQLPEAERYTLAEDYLHDRLGVMLGGRVAERQLLGSVSSGADDDIRQATDLARAMVGRWGMDESVGPVNLRESDEHPFLGRSIAQPRQHSEASARAVDHAVRKMLERAEGRAGEIIEAQRDGMQRLIEALEAHETLDRAQIEACLRGVDEKSSVIPFADKVSSRAQPKS